jgi:hypothetical protein
MSGSKQAFLSHRGPGVYTVAGVGTFGSYPDLDADGRSIVKKLDEIAVSESIATQFSTEEMKREGWVVERRSEQGARSREQGAKREEPEAKS